MASPKELKDLTRGYLLGMVNTQEKDAVEDHLFGDDAFLVLLEAAEEELINEYLLNTLSPTERAGFEEHFLASPRRRRSMELTQGLMSIAATVRRPAPGPQRRNWLVATFQLRQPPDIIAVIASIVAIAFAGLSGWLAIRLSGERKAASIEQQQAKNQIEQLKREKTAALRHPEPHSLAPGSIFSFVLSPGLMRDNNARLLTIGKAARTIQITLLTDRMLRPGRYAVTIRGDNGDEIWRSDLLTHASANQATISIPSGALEQGGYILTLSKVNEPAPAGVIDDYSFRVAY